MRVTTTEIDRGYTPGEEAQKILDNDAIIWQMPGWWMGEPWIVKKYIDEVFTAGGKNFLHSDGRHHQTPDVGYGTGGLLTNMIRSTMAPLSALTTVAVFKWSQYDATIPMAPWSQGSKVIYRKVLFLYCVYEVFPGFIEMIPYFFYDLVGDKREQMYLALNERRALVATEVSDEMQTMLQMLREEEQEETGTETPSMRAEHV